MASYCFQCNVDLYFGPHSDFKGLCGENALAKVLCEGCGPIRVDSRGWCVDPRCAYHAVPPSGRSDPYGSAAAWAARRVGAMGWAYRLVDRLRGTPWEPGYVHHWRCMYYNWREKVNTPSCYQSNPGPQQQAENCCDDCSYQIGCFAPQPFLCDFPNPNDMPELQVGRGSEENDADSVPEVRRPSDPAGELPPRDI